MARVAANQVRSDPAAAGRVAARKAAAAEVPRVAGEAALVAETANVTCLITSYNKGEFDGLALAISRIFTTCQEKHR